MDKDGFATMIAFPNTEFPGPGPGRYWSLATLRDASANISGGKLHLATNAYGAIGSARAIMPYPLKFERSSVRTELPIGLMPAAEVPNEPLRVLADGNNYVGGLLSASGKTAVRVSLDGMTYGVQCGWWQGDFAVEARVTDVGGFSGRWHEAYHRLAARGRYLAGGNRYIYVRGFGSAPFTLRLQRVGDVWSGFWDRGEGWKVLGMNGSGVMAANEPVRWLGINQMGRADAEQTSEWNWVRGA